MLNVIILFVFKLTSFDFHFCSAKTQINCWTITNNFYSIIFFLYFPNDNCMIFVYIATTFLPIF